MMEKICQQFEGNLKIRFKISIFLSYLNKRISKRKLRSGTINIQKNSLNSFQKKEGNAKHLVTGVNDDPSIRLVVVSLVDTLEIFFLTIKTIYTSHPWAVPIKQKQDPQQQKLSKSVFRNLNSKQIYRREEF